MKQIYYASIFFVFIVPVIAWGAIDTYEFESKDQQERFNAFTNELRCPKCQNQNIADSNSEIATDLRRELHRLLGEGKSDEHIVDFMVSRYGDFVLYKPPVNTITYPLWFGPFVLIFIGSLIVFSIARRSKKPESDLGNEVSQNLSNTEKQRLEALLQQKQNGDGK
ncbi:MAG: cytochrome c-type biogenesis protein [Methylococcaceae bacterium]